MGVIAEPVITEHLVRTKDEVLVGASDGVWSVLSSAKVHVSQTPMLTLFLFWYKWRMFQTIANSEKMNIVNPLNLILHLFVPLLLDFASCLPSLRGAQYASSR